MVRQRVRLTTAAAALLVSLAVPSPAVADCSRLLPAAGQPPLPKRPIEARDLIELRQIGDPDPSRFGLPSPLAVSPDGRRVAFVIVQADLVQNDYCRGVAVVNLGRDRSPHMLDSGGDPIPAVDVQRGFYVQTGASVVTVPIWSPDGRAVAFLKRLNGSTQVWVASVEGSDGRQVTHAPGDVEEVAWSADGRRLIYAARTDLPAAETAVDQEGLSGWLYDDRISPDVGPRPQPRADASPPILALDLTTGAGGPADPSDRQRLPANAASTPVPPEAVSQDGRRAWTDATDTSPLAARVVTAASASGAALRCGDPACRDGIIGLWWADDERTLLFLRREGWAKGQMALYRWLPAQSRARRVLLTSDVLQGCTPAGAVLACLRESSSHPRRLVLIDSASGAGRTVFDPNPEFAQLRLGKVERLFWRNDLGLEAWGDLALPPGYRPGSRLPMIVVQYHSDGFLRGGTGDEYPVFLLAAQGFAVLSTERPAFFAAALPALRTWYEVNAENQKNWSERRSLLSSVITGIDRAVAAGIADPHRVGITGLSDGATTVAFGLINSRRFAAAAISTCCMEPKTVMTYGGIAWAEWLRGMGYPAATTDSPEFWRPMSLALNARSIDTPLLLQLADGEYLLALEAFTALREQKKPVEMYVFPGEFHNKGQPKHRLAVYQRNIDWFRFWLQGREDPDPLKAAQYERWRELRSRIPVTARDGG